MGDESRCLHTRSHWFKVGLMAKSSRMRPQLVSYKPLRMLAVLAPGVLPGHGQISVLRDRGALCTLYPTCYAIRADTISPTPASTSAPCTTIWVIAIETHRSLEAYGT